MNKNEIIDNLIGDREFLKCELLYRRNIGEVKAILEMPQWEDEKFKGLLTSNIWSSNLAEVKAILEMPQWEDKKFKGLLTSNIWKSNSTEVKAILEMPELKNERYSHLLQPSIFNISIKNIRPTIDLFKEYGIDAYISNRTLRRNVIIQRKLLKYMKEHNIPFVEEDKNGKYKLNKIINSSNTELKNKYYIDLEKIVDSKIEGPSLDD